jgi:osmotically inducible protein OsmC
MSNESHASAVWEGSLTKGRGRTSTSSGTLDEVEVTWQARVDRTDDTTSPEELLAAAHAACYCMALSHELSEAGNEPERLEARASVAFVAGEGVKSSHIEISGTVPGIDAEEFESAAQSAGRNCPISGALKGNVEITVDASFNG